MTWQILGDTVQQEPRSCPALRIVLNRSFTSSIHQNTILGSILKWYHRAYLVICQWKQVTKIVHKWKFPWQHQCPSIAPVWLSSFSKCLFQGSVIFSGTNRKYRPVCEKMGGCGELFVQLCKKVSHRVTTFKCVALKQWGSVGLPVQLG